MLRILAAFIFFTRLPFWRLAEVPSEYFKNVVSRWALVGWLTAGLSVIVLYTASLILPVAYMKTDLLTFSTASGEEPLENISFQL